MAQKEFNNGDMIKALLYGCGNDGTKAKIRQHMTKHMGYPNTARLIVCVDRAIAAAIKNQTVVKGGSAKKYSVVMPTSAPTSLTTTPTSLPSAPKQRPFRRCRTKATASRLTKLRAKKATTSTLTELPAKKATTSALSLFPGASNLCLPSAFSLPDPATLSLSFPPFLPQPKRELAVDTSTSTHPKTPLRTDKKELTLMETETSEFEYGPAEPYVSPWNCCGGCFGCLGAPKMLLKVDVARVVMAIEERGNEEKVCMSALICFVITDCCD